MDKVLEHTNDAVNKKKEAEQMHFISLLKADIERGEKENINKIGIIKELQDSVENFKEKLKDVKLSSKKQNNDYIAFHGIEIEKLKKENALLLNDKELEWG